MKPVPTRSVIRKITTVARIESFFRRMTRSLFIGFFYVIPVSLLRQDEVFSELLAKVPNIDIDHAGKHVVFELSPHVLIDVRPGKYLSPVPHEIAEKLELQT